MALLPKVKLKTLPTFPSAINGGVGIDVAKQNGALTVDLDYTDFGVSSSIPTSPTSYILTYDTQSTAYVMVPSHLLGGGVSGIADAPIEGTAYARESASWVQTLSSFGGVTGALTQEPSFTMSGSQLQPSATVTLPGSLAVAGPITTGGGISSNTAASYSPQYHVTNSASDASAGYFISTKSRADGAVIAGDNLGTLLFQGVASGGSVRNAAFILTTVQNVGASFVATYLNFCTEDTSGNSTARLQVTPSGAMVPPSMYMNFGSTDGSAGYGIRDNGGILQTKNSGGGWSNIPSASTSSTSSFDVNATVQGTSVPASLNFIRTAGYYAIGDGGGALYRRVGSQPSHAGKIQSADGAWWEFCDSAINVHQFGARGNGSTDDSAAINNAIAYMKLPGGNAYPILHFGHPTLFQYVIAHTLNFTGMRNLRTTIDFENCILLGQCTGQPIIDALDSRFLEFKNGFFYGDTSQVPRYGIQMGVGIAGNGADNCKLTNMLFSGDYAAAGFLNAGCEVFHAENCLFWNAYSFADCVIQDGRNASHVSSQFFTVTAPQDTYISFQDNEFTHCTFEQTGPGPTKPGCSVRVFGTTHSHRYLNCYAQCDYGSAFILIFDHYMMTLDVHCEVTHLVNNVLLQAGEGPMILYGFRMTESFGFATNGYLASDGSGNVIDFVSSEIEIGTSIPNSPVFGPGGRVNFHGKIKLGPNPALYNLGNLNALAGDLELRLPQSTLVLPALRSVRAVSHDTVTTTYYGVHTFVT